MVGQLGKKVVSRPEGPRAGVCSWRVGQPALTQPVELEGWSAAPAEIEFGAF